MESKPQDLLQMTADAFGFQGLPWPRKPLSGSPMSGAKTALTHGKANSQKVFGNRMPRGKGGKSKKHRAE